MDSTAADKSRLGSRKMARGDSLQNQAGSLDEDNARPGQAEQGSLAGGPGLEESSDTYVRKQGGAAFS